MATRRARARQRMERSLERVMRKAEHRAEEIAEFIVDEIRDRAPYDPLHDYAEGPHLRDSYRLAPDPDTGGWVILARNRYWQFVEFGTREHGDAQPHIRPAIEYARGVFS